MLKAVAGGGGRGMRAVFAASELEAAFGSCSREAEAAFGDGRVFAERAIERPKKGAQAAQKGDEVRAGGTVSLSGEQLTN